MAVLEEEQAGAEAAEPVRRGRWRKIRRGLLVSFGALLVAEMLLRVGAFLWHERSPYYLFYGFPGLVGRVGISPWSVYTGEHYKFPANYELSGAAGQKSETAHINALGMRGVDFSPEKPRGTFRILCLGGSSTFGFHNADHETYPYQLQELLDEEYERVEVINAGFPYYHTGCILGLLEEELLDYEPDLLTVYSAYNDACWPLELGWPLRCLFWVQQHSVAYLLLKETVLTDERVYKKKAEIVRKLSPELDEETVLAEAARVAKRYRANIERILETAGERGIPVLLVRQPMTVQHGASHAHQRASYAQERAVAMQKLRDGAFMNQFEQALVRHARILEELDAIAAERELRVVDNVAIVDRERALLSSWVHLTAEGNRRLAEALREAVRPLLHAHRREPVAKSACAPPGVVHN